MSGDRNETVHPIDNPDLNGQRADFERSIYERCDAEDADAADFGSSKADRE